MPSRVFRLLIVPVVLAFATVASAQNSLPKESPFAPQGGAPVATAAATETLEFVGVSTVGKKTDLAFSDKVQKKSRWVTVGETVDGLAVLNYDPRLEQAVIKVDGVQKVLSLKKPAAAKGGMAATVPSAIVGPMPPPAGWNTAPTPPISPAAIASATGVPPSAIPPAATPSAPPVPNTPEAQAKQETEARMLVSDLLEIGMVQRKAYEEAQRKAAEGTPPPSNSNPAPVPTGPAGQPVTPAPAPGG